MYAVDIARVRKSECDFAARTLVTDRDKTGVTRVAVLWDRTIEAIRRLPKTNHTHLFLSREGRPYDADGLRTAFRKLRDKAGVDESVKFNHIRDGAYTAAIEGGADLTKAKMLAGHETGISDAYLKRKPSMVADAVAAIEKHYFD